MRNGCPKDLPRPQPRGTESDPSEDSDLDAGQRTTYTKSKDHVGRIFCEKQKFRIFSEEEISGVVNAQFCDTFKISHLDSGILLVLVY